jgi:hypothetical protein
MDSFRNESRVSFSGCQILIWIEMAAWIAKKNDLRIKLQYIVVNRQFNTRNKEIGFSFMELQVVSNERKETLINVLDYCIALTESVTCTPRYHLT